MKVKDLYQWLGENTSPEDEVVILDQNSSITYGIQRLEREDHLVGEDSHLTSQGATAWIVVEES